jgi:hypothetical protein
MVAMLPTVAAAAGAKVAERAEAPAPLRSPLRDAWRLATIFYPEVATDSRALVSFRTRQIIVAAMEGSTASGWTAAGPFILRVQGEAGANGAPLLEADIVIDRDGGLRSFTVARCQLFDSSGLDALSKELTDHHAKPDDVDRRLRARFAAYPPSMQREADAAFREKFRAASAILGPISIEEVLFGPSPTRDPADQTVELQWIVTGWRGGERLVALFEPLQGRLRYLQFF